MNKLTRRKRMMLRERRDFQGWKRCGCCCFHCHVKFGKRLGF